MIAARLVGARPRPAVYTGRTRIDGDNGHNAPLQLHRDDNSTDSNCLNKESFGKKELQQAKIKA
jgi:hypothetical protein